MLNQFVKIFLKVLLVLAIIGVSIVLFLAGYIYKLSRFPAKADVPFVVNLTKIEGRSTYDKAFIPVTIDDPEKIRLVVDFINQFQEKWYTPFPKARIGNFQFTMYRNDKQVYWFSFSQRSMSAGTFPQCDVPEGKMKAFIKEACPPYYEAMFPVVPAGAYNPETLAYWRNFLSGLSGVSAQKLRESMIENDISATMVYLGSFMMVNLKVINEGKYVDTVINAKIDLNKDNSVAGVRFDGFAASQKIPPEKRLLYWHKKLAELPSGAPFNVVREFIAKNNLSVLEENADEMLIKLAFFEKTWIREADYFGPGDVVISARIKLDKDKNLVKAELLGFQNVKTSKVSK